MLHSAHNSTLLQGVHIDGPRTVQSTAVYEVLKSVQIQRNMTDLVSVVKDTCFNVLMRDEKEGRKKQARSNKPQDKTTQHTRSSHFSKEKMNCLGLDFNPCYSTL